MIRLLANVAGLILGLATLYAWYLLAWAALQ